MKSLLVLSMILITFFSSCSKDEKEYDGIDHKQEMRKFVIEISEYAKAIEPGFYIIPQNGIELVTESGEDDGIPHLSYLKAIDGNGQEDLFYGYVADNVATPDDDNLYLRTLLDISKTAGNIILVTDYCSTPSKMDDSFAKNSINGYLSFSANRRELDNIPAYPIPIYAENNSEVISLEQVQNFLYLINPTSFSSKLEFITVLKSTNYDLLIMDLFFTDGTAFTNSEISQLKSKANGGSRLIIAYLSIGEAEDYRYYWQTAWHPGNPSWLDNENPDWDGNYKVKYWLKEWQNIIYGNDNSYLKKILDAGFDGAYLDIIDAFEYFE